MHNFKHDIIYTLVHMQVVFKENFDSIILIIPEKSVIKCEIRFIQYPFLNLDTFLGHKYSGSSFLSPPPPSSCISFSTLASLVRC